MGIKKLFISDEFWDRVANIHPLLQPVAKGILILEGDVSQIVFVCRLSMNSSSTYINIRKNANQDWVIDQIIEASIEMDTDESDSEAEPIHEDLES